MHIIGLQSSDAELLGRVKELHATLLKAQHAKLFSEPVPFIELGLDDYLDVVDKPMDFGTVQQRLESGEYGTVDAYMHDVVLTLSNALKYNVYDSDLYFQALLLRQQFDRHLYRLLSMVNPYPLVLNEVAQVMTEKHRRQMREVNRRLLRCDEAQAFLEPLTDKDSGLVVSTGLIDIKRGLEDMGSLEQYVRTVLVMLAAVLVRFSRQSKEYKAADTLQVWFRQQKEIET